MKQPTKKKVTITKTSSFTQKPVLLGCLLVILFVFAILGAMYMMNSTSGQVANMASPTPTVILKTTIATLNGGDEAFSVIAPETITVKNGNGGGCTDPKDTDCKNTWISMSTNGKIFMTIEAPSVSVLNAYTQMVPLATTNLGNLYRATVKAGEDPNIGFSTFKTIYLSEIGGRTADKCYNQEGKVVSAPCGISSYGTSAPDAGKEIGGGYFTAACASDTASIALCDNIMKSLQFHVN